MQKEHTYSRKTPYCTSVLVSLMYLSLLIGTSASVVMATTQQQAQSSGNVGEERFLQRFISNALDQKESVSKPINLSTRDATEDSRDATPQSPRRFVPSNLHQQRYANATLKMTIGLAVMLAFLGAAGFLMRRYLRKPRFFGKRDNALRVLSRINVTPKSSVALLEVPGKLLVIGISATHLTALAEIPVTSIGTAQPTATDPFTSFAETLHQETETEDRQFPGDDPLLHVPERIQRKVSNLKQL